MKLPVFGARCLGILGLCARPRPSSVTLPSSPNVLLPSRYDVVVDCKREEVAPTRDQLLGLELHRDLSGLQDILLITQTQAGAPATPHKHVTICAQRSRGHSAAAHRHDFDAGLVKCGYDGPKRWRISVFRSIVPIPATRPGSFLPHRSVVASTGDGRKLNPRLVLIHDFHSFGGRRVRCAPVPSRPQDPIPQVYTSPFARTGQE